jgi:nucleoside 2-deoxyribosyltransferase
VANPPVSYHYYHAGELFSLKHLSGNLALAKAIADESGGRYSAILPQNLEVDASRSSAIRDADLLNLLAADVALFDFDGTELDSGTVVEFVVAKFADIPAVLLRTDFRRGGDSHRDPWNLMVSDWPRTEKVIIHAMELYQSSRPEHGADAAEEAIRIVARQVVNAFKVVAEQPPVLPPDLREAAYRWLSLAPGFGLTLGGIETRLRDILERKINRALL